MSETWFVRMKRADFSAIAAKFNIDQVVARLLRNRDICGDEIIAEYLNGEISDLPDTLLMKDMDKAINILRQKIVDGAQIRVVGDYDIDGITATYILKSGLKSLGADVSAVIPHRIRDGYGINTRIIEEAHRDHIDTIITCDNGISAQEAVDLAHRYGMTFIVTDHHEVLNVPNADAVVDPKQEDCPYPFKSLCGGAISWLLIREMSSPLTDELLPFAAFATVGDVVPLKGVNRILAKRGIEAMRKTKHLGINMLAKVNKLDISEITSYHLGFVLGPCINAAGRLDDAMLSLSLLEASDRNKAERLAVKLRDLNERRKQLTEDAVAMANDQIEEYYSEDKIYVIYLPDCHESVAGIVAGRIREKHHHPTIVLTRGKDGIKGSGRSTDVYNMFEGLSACRKRMKRFGGHSLAAGLSLIDDDVEGFRRCLNENCHLTMEDFDEKIYIDADMPMSYVSVPLIKQFDVLEPCGKDNEKALFAIKNVIVKRKKLLGQDANTLKMTLMEPDGFEFEAIFFKRGKELSDQLDENPCMHIIYYPAVNDFRGQISIQAVITHYKQGFANNCE